MTYLITFSCHGHHMHGDELGSVDRHRSLPGGPLVPPSAMRVSRERRLMDQPPYEMDRDRRDAVLSAIVERCSDRHWNLLAAHVRSNHVHVVVDAEGRPERIMNDLKSYASRCLNRLERDEPGRKRWARLG